MTRNESGIGDSEMEICMADAVANPSPRKHNNPPFLPSPLNPSNMKLSKYVFLLPSAVEKVSKRYDVRTIRDTELFVLYSIQYLPSDCSQQSIIRHAKHMNNPISVPSVSLAVKYLSSVGFITYQDNKLALSPLGREFLSGIRRFLLNKRL